MLAQVVILLIRVVILEEVYIMARPSRNLTKSEILDAFEKCKSIHSAARYLRISETTLRKYAKVLVPQELVKQRNQGGKGMFRSWKKKDFKGILEGKQNGRFIDKIWFRNKLIKEALIEEKCNLCDFSEKRVIDEKCPLLLDYINGDEKDHKLDNLQLLCYNCKFLTVGNIHEKKKEYLYDSFSGEIIEEIDFGNENKRNLEDDLEISPLPVA